MAKYVKYLWYVIRHKWFVFVECCKLGIPLAGILHDWNKFLPDEFFPYVNYFYGGWRGESMDRQKIVPRHAQEAFDLAWLKHQRRNRHHWQAWILYEDSGDVKVFDMPMRYRKEMLADWRGAGRALGKPDTLAWYEANHQKQKINIKVRYWLETQLGPVFDTYCQPHQAARKNEAIFVNTIASWPTGAPCFEVGENNLSAIAGADLENGELCGMTPALTVYPFGKGHFRHEPEWKLALTIGDDD